MELRPVRETTSDYEKAEERIKVAFKEVIYFPLLRELALPNRTIKNSLSDLNDALSSGKITFSRGTFSGEFNSSISKELKKLGAKWDKKNRTFKIQLKDLPAEIRASISTSHVRFQERLARIDKRLSQILPEEITDRLKFTDVFSSALWKVDKDIRKSLEKITVAPELDKKQRERIAEEWQGNMDLWIKTFAEKEIKDLRKTVMESAFKGNRYESLIGTIQKSYNVTANKAKFLARQETSLLMTKFKEVRYTSLGSNEYKWRTVAGSALHPVRRSHKILDGIIYRWDTPPVSNSVLEPGQKKLEPPRRNNPGQDYNCRCMAIPIVNLKDKK